MVREPVGLGTALVVMAKLPVSGNPKTRLSGMLCREQRATLQAALIGDALAKARQVGTTYLAFTPGHARDEATNYIRTEVFPQVGMDLGQRMAHAVEEVTSRGHSPAIIIGTDCPYLSVDDLRQAAQQLKEADVCLGPAFDGGYYLIGTRHPDRRVFVDVPWGSPLTLKVTIERLSALGLSHGLLRPLPDVDTLADFRALVQSIAGDGQRLPQSPQVSVLLRKWHVHFNGGFGAAGPSLA